MYVQATDVDVIVVGSATLLEIVSALSPVQEELRREINPVVMTARDFRSQYANKDRFVDRVMNEPKTFVVGGMDDLAELVEDRAAGSTRD